MNNIQFPLFMTQRQSQSSNTSSRNRFAIYHEGRGTAEDWLEPLDVQADLIRVTPDAKKVLWVSEDSHCDLQLSNLSEEKRQAIASFPGKEIVDFRISGPTGSAAWVALGNPEMNWPRATEIIAVDLESGKSTPLLTDKTFSFVEFDVSPQGDGITYVDKDREVYYQALPAGEPVKISDKTKEDSDCVGHSCPRFSPNGARILYIGSNFNDAYTIKSNLFTAPITGGRFTLLTSDFDGYIEQCKPVSVHEFEPTKISPV